MKNSTLSRAATLRAAIAVAAVTGILGGCRSGAQTDIVEREMRHQEDQIYALQDDLSNYQQLVCQYRSENEFLKQQLSESQPTATAPAAKSNGSKSRLKPSPQTPIPPSRKQNGPQLNEPETPPGVPKLDLGEPEVPPLRDTSADDRSDSHGEVPATAVAPNPPSIGARLVSYETTAKDPADAAPDAISAPAADASESLVPTDQPEQVVLRGQIVRDDAAEGPRILADVEPGLSSGQPVAFRGRLSLMVLDPRREGRPSSIARWDFSADELEHVTVRTAEGTALEFPLQLPPGAPTDRPVELWVRLLRNDGQKLLAHATIDLSRAGQFCSAGQSTLPTVVRAVQIVDSSAPSTDSRLGAVRKTDWQIARPDDPRSQSASQGEPSSEWRTATQPVPMVRCNAARIASALPPITPSSPTESARPMAPASKAANRTAPDWSPERADDSKSELPAWAPTR